MLMIAGTKQTDNEKIKNHSSVEEGDWQSRIQQPPQRTTY
jgi:hypothetical protein